MKRISQALISLLLVAFSISVAGQTRMPIVSKEITKKQRAEWQRRLKWPADCEEAFQETFNSPEEENFGGLEFHRLGIHTFIVEITCYRGAYQPGSIVAWYDSQSQESKLLKFKGMESEDKEHRPLPYSETYGFLTWHRKSRSLEIFAKYRGLGNCGFWGLYKFRAGNPVLVNAREKECDDKPYTRRSIDYRTWPKKRL